MSAGTRVRRQPLPGTVTWRRWWAAVVRTPGRRYAAAFVFFLLLTCAWYVELIVHLRSADLIGPADSTLSIRSYWAIHYQHGGPFSFTHDYLNGAPEGVPYFRAVAIAQPVQTAAVWATYWFLGFLGAFNLFLLSGVVLTGFFGFLLLDRLGFHPLVGLYGGYVLAFNPWCFMRAFAGHAAFLHVWIFLAMILCFLEMSKTHRLRWAVLAGVCYGGSFLISSYFGLLGTLIFVLYFVFEFFRVRGWPDKLWTTTLACAAVVPVLASIAPGAIAYRIDHHQVLQSISNPTGELQRLGAATASYFLPARNHPLFGPITRHFTSSENFAEQTLFFGYTTMVLAIIGIVLLVRRHPVTQATPMRRTALVFTSILLPLAYWSSLRRVIHPLGIPVPSLSFFLGHVTTFFRVYARFGVVVGIALVVLAAPTLDLIIRRYRRGVVIALGLWALVAFELLPGRVYAWAGASRPPAYDTWLAHQPMSIVAHYPLPTDQEPAIHLGEREIYYQMFHGHPLYNIFGPGTGNTREDAIRILSRYVTDPNTPSILAAEHVKLVFVHDDVYAEEHEPAPTLLPADFALVRRFPNVRVYRLLPTVKPADLSTLLEQNAASIAAVEGLHAPTVTYDGFATRNATGWRSFGGSGSARITVQNHDANLHRLQFVAHIRATRANESIQLMDGNGNVVATSAVSTQDTQVTLGPFALPQGKSTYSLRTTSAEESQLGAVLVQPIADFSFSLAAG